MEIINFVVFFFCLKKFLFLKIFLVLCEVITIRSDTVLAIFEALKDETLF